MDHIKTPLSHSTQLTSNKQPSHMQNGLPLQRKADSSSIKTLESRTMPAAKNQHKPHPSDFIPAQIPLTRTWTDGISIQKVTKLVNDCLAYDQLDNTSFRASNGSLGNGTGPHVQQDYNTMQAWLNETTKQQAYNNVRSIVELDTQEGLGDIRLGGEEGAGEWWSTANFNVEMRTGKLPGKRTQG